MKLQLKNKHIHFALGDIWEMLNYKLKFQINEIVTANEDLETLQEVDRKSTRLNSSHITRSRMPSSA